MKLPVDFEQRAKMPPAANGSGYPHQISARDLMANFKAVQKEVDPSKACGLYLQETGEGENRKIKLAGTIDAACLNASTGGSTVTYPDGTQYGIPTPPSTGTYVLGSIDGSIQWIATTEC